MPLHPTTAARRTCLAGSLSPEPARTPSRLRSCHHDGVRTRSQVAVAFALGLALAATSLPSVAQDRRARAHVRMVLLGDFPRRWIEPVRAALERDLRVRASVDAQPLPLPRAAYYRPRRRYRAERLLEFLGRRFASEARDVRVLGLTRRDISTTSEPHYDWGILGLADIGGRAAVVSSFRVRRRASPEQALFRMTTTAVHEVGHVLGLDHCDESRCLMRDAEGTMDTVDAGDGALGPSCRARLDEVAPLR